MNFQRDAVKICVFFCETVSALLRHPYICTHRCAFNADIYVHIIRYIYIYVIGIIFGPLNKFTNVSILHIYNLSIYINIYIHTPMSSDMSSNLEMHLFQLPGPTLEVLVKVRRPSSAPWGELTSRKVGLVRRIS